MPSLRPWHIVGLALSLLTACSGPDTLPALSKSALSETCQAKPDERLIGDWYWQWSSEYKYYLQIHPQPGGCGLTVFGFLIESQSGTDSVSDWVKADAYPTVIDRRTYYNVTLLIDAGSLYGLANAPDGYLIAEFDTRDTLQLSIRLLGFATSSYQEALQEKRGHYALDKLAQAGLVKSHVVHPKGAKADYHVLEQTRTELVQLFRSIPPELLMSEWQGPLLRFDRGAAS